MPIQFTNEAGQFPSELVSTWDELKKPNLGFYESKGAAIGKLVDEKNVAYGDSFHQSGRVLKVLYPHGIKPEQYDKALYIVRVIDKLFRLATDNDKFGESPARDIAGYSILL